MALDMGLIIRLTIVCLSFTSAMGAYTKGDCGGTFTEPDGVFYSPGHPNKYPKNVLCTYKFRTGHPVTIDCPEFKLQKPKKNGDCKNKNWLQLDDNIYKTKFCGKEGPHHYTTEGASPNITFKSVPYKQKPGFFCTYTSAPVLLTQALNLFSETNGICSANVRTVAQEKPSSRNCSVCSVTNEDSEFYTTIVGDYRLVVANGIPNHIYEEGQEFPNPNNACPHEVYMAVPANPKRGNTYTKYGMGTIGISISGGFFFNHMSSPHGDVAANIEGISFDNCNGHSNNVCQYHYHKVPLCIAGKGKCNLVGYMRDGFAVYTFCSHESEDRKLKSCHQLNAGEDGTHESHYTYNITAYNNGDCDLDYANGYIFGDERGYAYVFTKDYPFIMMGSYGQELADICFLS